MRKQTINIDDKQQKKKEVVRGNQKIGSKRSMGTRPHQPHVFGVPSEQRKDAEVDTARIPKRR